MIKLILSVVCYFMAGYLMAATYYVSPAGSDDGLGTEAAPWKSLQKAAGALKAGDTLLLRGGTYNQIMTIRANGDKDNYITVKNYPKEKAVIDGKGVTVPRTLGLVGFRGASFIKVSGIEVRNSNQNGVIAYSNSTHIVLKNLSVHDNAGSGIMFNGVKSPGYSKIINCESFNNMQSGIVLWSCNGGYYLVEGNQVYDNEGRGNWDGIQAGDTPYTIIRDNTVSAMGKEGDYIDSGGNQNSKISLAHHIIYDNNLVYQGKGASTPVKLNNRPSHSIIRKNRMFGVGLTFYEEPHKTVAIYNNTILNAVHALQLWNSYCPLTFQGITVKNNIFAFSKRVLMQHGPNKEDGTWPQIKMDGNLYRFSDRGIEWASPTANTCYGTSKDDYERWRTENKQEPHGGTWTQATMKELFANPEKHDAKLAENSPAIDAGQPLTTTVAAGKGTKVPVKESFYFFDGFGMVPGDLVRIGNNKPVRIVKIDDDARTLTVDKEIAWGNGSLVTLPYKGTAPDAGAVEK